MTWWKLETEIKKQDPRADQENLRAAIMGYEAHVSAHVTRVVCAPEFHSDLEDQILCCPFTFPQRGPVETWNGGLVLMIGIAGRTVRVCKGEADQKNIYEFTIDWGSRPGMKGVW